MPPAGRGGTPARARQAGRVRIAVVLLVTLGAVAFAYRRQIVRRVTRRKGVPDASATVAWAPPGSDLGIDPTRPQQAELGPGRRRKVTSRPVPRAGGLAPERGTNTPMDSDEGKGDHAEKGPRGFTSVARPLVPSAPGCRHGPCAGEHVPGRRSLVFRTLQEGSTERR